ncbi:acyltransferase [Rhodomicrobium sp. Az07]|uniref:acyltransferase family protein n=1 Tax=Rhodomicrobium sp. Az07 TaxID=2839034 RepID=UPI001BEAC6BA|nr:acyltransferase family protein [Rhodomicrobium sp. Az07]MBT3071311.1 acyltransferase [Rhodomicrobium sp. Az07]
MIGYRSEIDGLRGIAIASVVLFHSGSSQFQGGYVGVDVFFVISGYLITSIIIKESAAEDFSYLKFYARRARRILPALFFMLTLVTVACTALFAMQDLKSYGELLAYTVMFAANLRLAGQLDYFHPLLQQNPLLHMWSLAVEEQFYIVWPTLLLALLATFSARRAILIVAALALASLAISAVLVEILPKAAFFHLPSRGWELLAGALLALGAFPRIRSDRIAEGMAVCGIALLLAPVFLYSPKTTFPGFAALPPVLGCALVIWAETSRHTRVGALLSLRPIVFLGLISYSLYLWHWPIFSIAKYMSLREPQGLEGPTLIALAMLMGWFSWRFVEKPFRRKSPASQAVRSLVELPRQSHIPRIPLTRLGYAAGACATLLLASGGMLYFTHGLPSRISPQFESEMRDAWVVPLENCSELYYLGDGLKKCETGDPSLPARETVMLWGDSHAQHFQRLISAIWPRTTTYFRNACSPVPGVFVVFRSVDDGVQSCFDQKAMILNEMLRTKPDIVVLAGRWWITGTASVLTEPQSSPTEGPREAFAAALRKTVERLTDAGIKVVVMDQVPEIPAKDSRCLGTYRLAGWNECYSASPEFVADRQGWVSDIVRATVRDNPRAVFYDAKRVLCASGTCNAFLDGNLLYRDGDHLSPKGALALVSDFRNALPPNFLPAAPDEKAETDGTPMGTLSSSFWSAVSEDAPR